MEVPGMVSSRSGQRRNSQENKRKTREVFQKWTGPGVSRVKFLSEVKQAKVWEGLLNLAARKFSRSVNEEKGGQPMEASLPRSWTLTGTRKSRIKTKQPFRVSRLEYAKSFQSCPTLCNPRDGSPPGSPIPGILQARTLEWVAISFSNA